MNETEETNGYSVKGLILQVDHQAVNMLSALETWMPASDRGYGVPTGDGLPQNVKLRTPAHPAWSNIAESAKRELPEELDDRNEEASERAKYRMRRT